MEYHIKRFSLQNAITAINLFLKEKNIYFSVYVGMGCQVFFINKNDEKTSIFMHSDSWGQYGKTTDDTPILNTYIYNVKDKTINFNDYINLLNIYIHN